MGLNISLEAWLIVFQANKVFGFINAEIFCQRVIVVPTEELRLNDFKYKW